MTRQRKPQLRQFHQTVAPQVARMQSVTVTQGTDAQTTDALNAGVYGLVGGGMAAIAAHGLALLLTWSTGGLELFAFGTVGLVVFQIRTWQIHESRLIKQSASFYDAEDYGDDAAKFAPERNQRTTLIRMHPLAAKMARFAQELPDRDYRLAFSLWEGGGKIFTRAEYKTVRHWLLKKGICRPVGNGELEVTTRGKTVLAAWATGLVDEDVVHATRPVASPPTLTSAE